MVEVEEETDTIRTLAGDISDHVAEERGEMEAVTGFAEQLSDIANEMHANIDKFDLGASLSASAPRSN